MLATSNEIIAAWLNHSRQLSIRVKVNDVTYGSEEITSLSFDSGSISGEVFQIGSTYMNSVQIVFPSIIESIAEDIEVIPELGVMVNGSYEYTKLGHFYVDDFDRNKNNNTTSITATDKMRFMEGEYVSKLTYPKAYREVALDIANSAGVEVSANSFASLGTGAINQPEGYTHRQAIGLIAQFEGGFASFNRNGELEIRRLAPTTFEITPESYLLKGFTKNESSYRIGGISVKTGEEETDVIRVGSTNGSQVELENKVMTQTLLNQMWELVKTLNYFPYELKWRGCPPLEAGDWIYIEDKDGTKYSVPNLSYSITFNGGMSAESKATTSSTSQATYKYRGSLNQKIDYLDSVLSANKWNTNYYGSETPETPKEGDIWFKPNGQDTEIWVYKNVDGVLKWAMEISSAGDPELLQAIEDAKQAGKEAQLVAADAKEAAEDAKQAGENAANLATQATLDAQTAKAKADAIQVDVNGLVSDVATINSTVSSISSKANEAYEKAAAVEGRTATLETSVTGLTGRMTDIETTSTSTTKKLNELVVTVDGQKQTIATVTTTADSALSKANVLETTVDGVTQTLTSVETTANSALSKVNTVSSTVDGHTQLIASTKTTADSALSKAVATETTANGLITTISSVETTANSALSKALQVEATASGITQTVVSIQEDLNSLSETTSSQFTQLSDQMNFKLTSSDGGVTQIDMQNQIVTISSENIYLTGKSNISDAIIKTAHIADLAVSNGKIANLAVTEGKIGDAAITNAKIGNLAVSTAKIADAAITDAKIGNLSATKITTGTLNAANVNIINLNASSITTGTISGANLSLNLATGSVLFSKGKIQNINETFYIDIDNDTYYSEGDTSASQANKAVTVLRGGTVRTAIKQANVSERIEGVQIIGNGAIRSYVPKDASSSLSLTDEIYNSNYQMVTDLKVNHNTSGSTRYGNFGVELYKVASGGTPSLTDMPYLQMNGVNSTFKVYAVNDIDLVTNNTLTLDAKRTDINGGGDSTTYGGITFGRDSSSARVWSMSIYNRTYATGNGDVCITSAGTLGRKTSARKYKADIKTADDVIAHAKEFLTIQPASWYDKKDYANGTAVDRFYGFIADEFHEKGLTEVVYYGDKGQVEGLAYDRLTMYQNVILNEHEQEIQRLKQEVSNLKTKVEELEAA